MTNYSVNIFREMWLYFPCIEADTPEEAALLAGELPAAEADFVEECNGENLAAQIEPTALDDVSEPVTIEFEAKRLRKAAPDMLAVLQRFEAVWCKWAAECRSTPVLPVTMEFFHIYEAALEAIAKATGGLPDRSPE